MHFPVSTIQQQLRHETQVCHARIHGMVPLLDPRVTPQELRGVLRCFYGFYAPLESRMYAAAQGPLEGEVRARRKTPWLVHDLVAMGDTQDRIAELPWCTDLPPMASPGQLLGVLYVLEGATLGGQVIAEALRRHIGKEVSCRFFTSYGDQVPAMWGSFLDVLTKLTTGEEAERCAVASAQATFESLERWLQGYSSTSRDNQYGSVHSRSRTW
jgi:heme oxygenase